MIEGRLDWVARCGTQQFGNPVVGEGGMKDFVKGKQMKSASLQSRRTSLIYFGIQFASRQCEINQFEKINFGLILLQALSVQFVSIKIMHGLQLDFQLEQFHFWTCMLECYEVRFEFRTGRQCRFVTLLSRIWKVPLDDQTLFPASIYLFKANTGNTRTMCEICSNLTVETPEWRQWHHYGVFVVNYEQISHIVLLFQLLTLNNGWVGSS